MPKKPRVNTPLLIRLMSLLGETEVREEYIAKEKGRDIYGYLAVTGQVVVNPAPHIVDTLLHELLHKLHPEHSERAVRSIVGKLMVRMSDEELQAVYEMYLQKVAE